MLEILKRGAFLVAWLLVAIAGGLDKLSDLANAPANLKGLSNMWIVQALTNWITIVALIWMTLIAWGAGWFDRLWSQVPSKSRPKAAESALDRDGNSQPDMHDQRIPLMDVIALATSYGWDFNFYSDQLLVFLNGLRQAAIDGKIVLEGRLGLIGVFVTADNDVTRGFHPLESIPSDHIKKFRIDTPHMPGRQQNWRTRTYLPGVEASEESFVDIHVSSNNALRKWLARESVSLQSAQPDEDLEDAMVAAVENGRYSPNFVKDQIVDGAKREALTLYGRSCMGDNWVSIEHSQIPVRYWQRGGNIDLESFDLRDDRNEGKRKKQAVSSADVQSFHDLRVNRGAFLKFWKTAVETV